MKHILTPLFALALSLGASAQTTLTSTEMQAKVAQTSPATLSIHDPSATFRNGQFTIWGSHLGLAQGNDLQSLNGLTASNTTFRQLATQGAATGTACTFADAFSVQQATQVRNAKGEMVSFPNFDAASYCARYATDKASWLSGDMWAPDIIYNEHLGQWCLYLSLNGDHWSSIIVLLTAPTATGPFTYQGPIVMGGFDGQTRDGIAAPTYAETDLEIALGESLSATPARYIQSANGTYWPNCIDPAVFYDADGELWMTYGSWSGGIFMLKLDKETGLRDYTHTYASDYDALGADGVSDPYFGQKIAGGRYVSGEGPYIERIGDYYYLWVSYGFFSPSGGYDLRVFRSTSPTGPYTDQSGNSALFSSRYVLNYGPNTTQRGMRPVGDYNQWGPLQTIGQRAQGHNSVVQDDEGRTFLVMHTKFNDGTDGHQVRIHQLWLNSQGWPVAAPFIFTGQEDTDASLAAACPFTTEQLVGQYNVLLHPYGLDHSNYAEATPQSITLNANGSISGDLAGSWTMQGSSAHVTLRLGSTTYYGLFVPQQISGATASGLRQSGLTAIAFTALSPAGNPVWGYKLDDESAVSQNWSANAFPLRDNQSVTRHQRLMFDATDNAEVSWTSSHPDIISETGKYSPVSENTQVTLTRTIRCGDAQVVESATVNAIRATEVIGDAISGLVAYYMMDETPVRNQYKALEAESYDRASLTRSALASDWDRLGQVLQITAGSQGSHSFARMPNPLKDQADLEGFCVSLWVKRESTDSLAALWALGSNYGGNLTAQHIFLTGNAHVDYSNGSDTSFKVNDPATAILNTIPANRWTLVTLTVGSSNGVRLYINGSSRNWSNYDSTPSATSARTLPYEAVIQSATALNYMFLGAGSGHGSPQCRIDELMVWNRELSATDVRSLYTLQQRTTDFTIGQNGTAIAAPKTANEQESGYSLDGRRTHDNHRGITVKRGGKYINR